MNLKVRPQARPKKIPTLTWPQCLLLSIAFHALLLTLSLNFHFKKNLNSPIEVDLTNPIIGSGPKKLGAPKRQLIKAPLVPAQPAPKTPPPKTPPTPKTWTLPNKNTQKAIPLPPQKPSSPGGTKTGTGTSPLAGGSGKGANYGSPKGTGNGGSPAGIIPPKLLNLNEVLKNLERFYPKAEREKGQEASVLVAIHIGIDGNVTGVDILKPAAADFNEAAQQVARLMKFSPARNAQGPIAVKIAQQMIFRLDN